MILRSSIRKTSSPLTCRISVVFYVKAERIHFNMILCISLILSKVRQGFLTIKLLGLACLYTSPANSTKLFEFLPKLIKYLKFIQT